MIWYLPRSPLSLFCLYGAHLRHSDSTAPFTPTSVPFVFPFPGVMFERGKKKRKKKKGGGGKGKERKNGWT